MDIKYPSVRWKIVVGHHPMYSGGKRKNSEDTLLFEKKFADLFDQYKVDAYICGHEHDLQIINPKEDTLLNFYLARKRSACFRRKRRNHICADIPGFMIFSIKDNQLLVQSVKANENGAKVLNKHKIIKKDENQL